MYKNVYHASHKQGLKEILPHINSHDEVWIYATPEMWHCAMFIKNRSVDCKDLSVRKGRRDKDSIMDMMERYPGAIEQLYSGVSGSIYVLPGDTFENKTGWSVEVVSEVPVVPITEILIPDVYKFLQEQEKQGLLKIHYYPNRPDYIPSDDIDLVNKIKQGVYKNLLIKLEKVNPEYHKKLCDAVSTNASSMSWRWRLIRALGLCR